MKNNCTAKSASKSPKIYVLLFLLCASFLFAPLSAQISLSLKNATVGQAIESIKNQTNYNFFYEDQVASLPVSDVQINNKKLAETLEILLKGKNVAYTIEDDMVYLTLKMPEETPAALVATIGKVVSGTVLDESGEPLIGVSIVVKGSTVGTITDFDGKYSIEVPATYSQLEFSYIGYLLQIVAIGNQSVVDIVMREDAQLIEEVVVTALGIKREKKMLGYAVQDIKGDRLNQTGDPSVTSALQGKVAGLQMNTASTGLGGSTKITIRGNSSLTDNNQPLWIVDGVPFTDNNTSDASTYGGIDRGGTSFDINPDDIESISVLKGPNAAALYGSRAGNGVILITTKKGTKKDGLGISYNGNFTWSEVAETLETQSKYGQGRRGTYIADSKDSFGAELDGSDVVAWNGQSVPYSRYGDKMKDYFNTAFSQNHNVSVGGATDKSHFRGSFGYNGNNGLFNGEKMNKTTIDINSGMELNKYITMDSKLSVSRTLAENRPYFGLTGEVGQLLLIPNNVRLSDLEHYSTPDKLHVNWTGPTNEYLNPYYVNHQHQNSDERWRAFGYYAANINLAKWLKFRGKYSFDYYRTRLESSNLTNGSEKDNIDDIIDDTMSRGEENFFEQNTELLFLGDTRFAEKFHLGYTLGGNIMYQKMETLSVGVRDMYYKDYWSFMWAKTLNTASASGFERATYSLFGSAQLAYNDYLSLDLTARMDWSSTLPTPHNYFYPSANLSFIITDFVRSFNTTLPTWLTFAKVRLSAAEAGKDAEPYQLINTSMSRYEDGKSVIVEPDEPVKVNPDLKPEISRSYEAGLDMKFFNNRLGFDFTYYYSATRNQIMTVPAADPWKWKRINSGLITNQGIELMIYSTLVQTKNFRFDLDLNLSRNISIVKELADNVNYMMFAGDQFFPVEVGAVAGGKLGEIYARKLIKRNENGEMILDESGLPVSHSGSDALQNRLDNPIGCIQPDLLMSVTPSIRYKGFSLSALFDMRFGGNIVSVSEGMMTLNGVAKRTEKRAPMILPGVKEDGTPNDVECTAESYYVRIGVNRQDGFAEEFVYDASYIKLKEISLGYSLPQSVLKKSPFTQLRFSLVGRNLAYLFKNAPGNADGGFDTSMFSQAIDFVSVPYTRTFGFSVNVDF